jgi:DNA polymerase I-like protein with 3'-5' exonuclease and polymerase domains
MDSLPALKSLRDRVEKAAAKGYLKGLDGRQIEVRSAHAALNTLLQGAGAVYMKQVMVMYYAKAKEEGLDFNQVSVVHDEINVEVREDQAPRLAEIMEEAFEAAGEHFNLRCPTKGNAKIGLTWYDVH